MGNCGGRCVTNLANYLLVIMEKAMMTDADAIGAGSFTARLSVEKTPGIKCPALIKGSTCGFIPDKPGLRA